MFGPLFHLQWFGLLCPCFQKEEDRNARQALVFVSGRRVLWAKGSASSGSGFSIGKLFSFSSSNSSAGGENEGSTPSGPQRAILRLGDNEEERPEIVLIPIGTRAENDGETDRPAPGTPSMELHIKLSRVDKVALDREEIVLSARPVKSNNSSSAPKELLRVSLLDSNNGPARDEERNLFLHHMMVLVEWERQRRDPYEDDDDEEDQPNFLQARAQKAKHFAQRELEMQTTKRDREKRKAKFVAESGGLKYTALAMAGRSDSR